MREHYHVVAVTDWDGANESWQSFGDEMNLIKAQLLASDIIALDGGDYSPDDYADLEEKYGANLVQGLTSASHSGWDAVWVTECGQDCQIDELLTHPSLDTLGDPHWSAV